MMSIFKLPICQFIRVSNFISQFSFDHICMEKVRCKFLIIIIVRRKQYIVESSIVSQYTFELSFGISKCLFLDW